MSGWLQLFPALELNATLRVAALIWQRSTQRNCLLLWNSEASGRRFAFAGERPTQPLPDWMERLVAVDEPSPVVTGELLCHPDMAGWLKWLGMTCHEKDLLVSSLALDNIDGQGQLCFAPSGRSVPAIDPVGLEVTTRALWQATLFETQLREQKLSALAELAAGAGHEVNNPLGTILGRSQQLLRDEQHPERRRWLATIGAQALRVRDMISDLMLFARPVPPKAKAIDLTGVINAVQSKFLTKDAASTGIVVDRDLQSDLVIAADATQVEIVLSELFRNSLFALSGQGVIRIAARRSLSAADPRTEVIRMTFSDSGPGLMPLEREHLFDPFFSGRQAGRGLGFGLSKCWQIVRAHGGTIRVAHPGGNDEAATTGLSLIVEWPVGNP